MKNEAPSFSFYSKNISKIDKNRLTNDAWRAILLFEVMNMNLSETRKVTAVFTALQAAALIAGALGTAISLLSANFGAMWLSLSLDDGAALSIAACVVGFAVLIAVSALCWVALLSFFRMCGRLKKERAFTAVNESALRRIARCFAVCAAALIVGVPAIRLLLGEAVLGMIWLTILAFLFFFLALIVQALALLVRRAELLQDENDLTV